MKTKYSFVCEGANISQSGNLNVLGIFQNINASEFPCTYPRMIYIACLEFHRSEIGKHKFKMSFIDDDGKNIMPNIEGEIEASPHVMFANIMIELNNVVFPRKGTYAIDLTVDNQHISSDMINIGM